jgi:hypothetical protein
MDDKRRRRRDRQFALPISVTPKPVPEHGESAGRGAGVRIKKIDIFLTNRLARCYCFAEIRQDLFAPSQSAPQMAPATRREMKTRLSR